MNFLAHIYLSGSDPGIIIGNFIGDFVKGRAWENFPEPIQNGILLHRSIDEFTDSHEIVELTKKRLRPKYHHYAPVISDVFYDHFLASLWSDYHPQPLIDFTADFYQLTNRYENFLPERATYMLSYMRRDNWLYGYQYLEGINRALTGMSRRTTFTSGMEKASKDLEMDYDLYKLEFQQFFPLLIHHAKEVLSTFKK